MKKLKLKINKSQFLFFIILNFFVNLSCSLNLQGKYKGDICEDIQFDEPVFMELDVINETYEQDEVELLNCNSDIDCDDANSCNGAEVCGEDNICHGGEFLPDGFPCTADDGNYGTCWNGTCQVPYCGNLMIEGVEQCDDGANGNNDDGCRDDCKFSCQSSENCNDGNICTADYCRLGGNGKICELVNMEIPCNDNNTCTVNDICNGGICSGTDVGAQLCDDGNICTDDICSPSDGCLHSFNSAPCDDGSQCTIEDTCSDGICIGTPAPDQCPCRGDEDCLQYEDEDKCNGSLTCDTILHACFVDPSTIVLCHLSEDPCKTNVCNPSTGECELVAVPDSDDRPCDDNNVCTNQDKCIGGVCTGTDISRLCMDSNDCTDEYCDPITGCTYVINSNLCDDGNLCTTLDMCSDAGICEGIPYTCTVRECVLSSVCDGMGGCIETYAAQFSPCDDGSSCSSNDMCTANGRCEGVKDDTLCPDGELCRPECFGNEAGCGLPPRYLNIECVNPVDIDYSLCSTCLIDLDMKSEQSRCINCEIKVGIAQLDYEDFGDSTGSCDTGSWRFLSGNLCYTAYDDSCNPTSTASSCCDSINSICKEFNGNLVLQTNKRTNCTPAREEWRITNNFDTTGLTDIEICFDVGVSAGTNNDEYLIIIISDGEGNSDKIFCKTGAQIKGQITGGVVDKLYPVCLQLPDWASNNPDLNITIVANSNNDDNIIYIDNISVTGRISDCAVRQISLFSENFSGCPNHLTDGWNGWRVAGPDLPVCPATLSCPGCIEANKSRWSIERDVDTRNVDGNVLLYFDVAEGGANAGESVTTEFSTDGGRTWKTAWAIEGNMGTDDVCHRITVNLSHIDLSAARNPALKIKFNVQSGDKKVDIGNIEIKGDSLCPSENKVLMSPVNETVVPGRYETQVCYNWTGALSATIFCSWDEPQEPVYDLSLINFRH